MYTENVPVLPIAPQTAYSRIVGARRRNGGRGRGRGRKREELEMWEEERDAGETSGVAGDRSDRVSWELAKRFVPPRGPYQPNWFVIPFHRRPAGLRAAAEDASGALRGSRESASAPV